MSPTTGRFVSKDPFDGDIAKPASIHRYMYANASPLMYHDPSGRFGVQSLMVVALIGMVALIVHQMRYSRKDFVTVDVVYQNDASQPAVIDSEALYVFYTSTKDALERVNKWNNVAFTYSEGSDPGISGLGWDFHRVRFFARTGFHGFPSKGGTDCGIAGYYSAALNAECIRDAGGSAPTSTGNVISHELLWHALMGNTGNKATTDQLDLAGDLSDGLTKNVGHWSDVEAREIANKLRLRK